MSTGEHVAGPAVLTADGCGVGPAPAPAARVLAGETNYGARLIAAAA